MGLDFLQENNTSVLCRVRIKFHFPLISPLLNDMKVMIQIGMDHILLSKA